MIFFKGVIQIEIRFYVDLPSPLNMTRHEKYLYFIYSQFVLGPYTIVLGVAQIPDET